MNLFSQLNVWKRVGKQLAVRYVCFCDLSSGRYAVQSADFFRMPIEDEQLHSSERQLIELFMEESPFDRCGWFETVGKAIEAHDLEFGDLGPPIRSASEPNQ
jgi:hypothetical protein